MPLEYLVTYEAENQYENVVNDAYWQFLVIPEENETQEVVGIDFSNSLKAINQFSINGYGFKTIRVHPKQTFQEIAFKATFKVIKKEINPFSFDLLPVIAEEYALISSPDFIIDFEPYLKRTVFTTLPTQSENIFLFDRTKSIFDNLQQLNTWVFYHIYFTTGVTDVKTLLDEIIEKRQGVCQDFSHLFCAIGRKNSVPIRYVSGYLHQGNNYFGDAQMHAWVEAFIPNIGWVGFDPTNNILANNDHIKVAHGKDYNDCSPLKGIVYTIGKNETKHTVEVSAQQ
jgi:transglutaminase-like putative cysteine protease